MKEQIKVI